MEDMWILENWFITKKGDVNGYRSPYYGTIEECYELAKYLLKFDNAKEVRLFDHRDGWIAGEGPDSNHLHVKYYCGKEAGHMLISPLTKAARYLKAFQKEGD